MRHTLRINRKSRKGRREVAGKGGSDIVSIARALSKLGTCSRSEAEGYILEGRIRVNNEIVRSSSLRVSLKSDKITLDGKVLLKKKDFYYIAMNKPRGFVTTRSDERGAKTVYDLLTAFTEWVFPVGRLDKETTGLLIFTNDAAYAETLTNPERRHDKTYIYSGSRPARNRCASEDVPRGRTAVG